jgi:hypothetical protein
MKRQIKHMIKYKYLPFSTGKKVSHWRSAPCSSSHAAVHAGLTEKEASLDCVSYFPQPAAAAACACRIPHTKLTAYAKPCASKCRKPAHTNFQCAMLCCLCSAAIRAAQGGRFSQVADRGTGAWLQHEFQGSGGLASSGCAAKQHTSAQRGPRLLLCVLGWCGQILTDRCTFGCCSRIR